MTPELNKIHLMDCMEGMSAFPNNWFELAIVDPEYGIGRDGGETGKHWKWYEPKDWDSKPPPPKYFKELFRVSKNQIIWGANYFTQYLPGSMGWIVWDKGQKLTMSDGELAFSSFDRALRIVTMNRCMIGAASEKVHPTQKPEALMLWLLDNYAKPGDKILDTHSGSGSVARACVKRGFDFCAFEIDPDYHRDSLRLLSQAKAGLVKRTEEEIGRGGGQMSILDQLG